MVKTLMLATFMAFAVSACGIYGGAGEPATRAAASRPPVAPNSGTTVSVVLSASQVALVREYFDTDRRSRGAHGNGRGRNGGLPPGIARNLQRGKTLPPGIARQTLPRELVVKLPATPTGIEYLVVAGKLLLVETATEIVRTVLLETVFG